MRDLTRFVGIPYLDKGTDPARGLDCWQLVRHFYASELHVALPDYMSFYDSSLNMRSVSAAMEAARGDWQPVAHPTFGDVLVFRIAEAPWHAAVMVDNGNMLHTDEGHGSVIETIVSLRWRNRFYGAFQWKS